jgi:hypothetical protein
MDGGLESLTFSLNRRFLFLDNRGASTSSGSSPLMDRRGLALPAGAAASDFNARPSTLKKRMGGDQRDALNKLTNDIKA